MAVIGFDNPLDDGQSHTGTFTDTLGADKGLKHVSVNVSGDTTAGILDADLYPFPEYMVMTKVTDIIFYLYGPHGNNQVAGALHGVPGVNAEIHE